MFNRKYFLSFLILVISMIFISPFSYALIEHGSMKIFAVSGPDSAMEATLNIEIHPGTGKVLANIDSLVGNTTQESQKNAVNATDLVIGNTKTKYDYIFEINSGAYSIDGPSAGAAMALLMVSMFKDKNIAEEVSMTGTISQEGYVGDVGGIYQKAKKASEVGIKLFMIPAGNREQVVTIDGNVEKIDLVEYAYDNWGLKVVEVQNLTDVLNYVSKNIDDINISYIPIVKQETYQPDRLDYSIALAPMRNITAKYVINAEENLEIAKANLNQSALIKDKSIQENIFSIIESAETAINEAKIYSANNYLYSAANNSFIAIVNVTIVNEILNNPSILGETSTVLDEKIKELEETITLAEKRSTLCSLEKIEWCIGARQRITWAEQKFNILKEGKTNEALTRVSDYSYAIGWIKIANDFLDVGITDSNYKFVESNSFKADAQKKIIDVENKLILASLEVSNDPDLLRRLDAAKINYEKGWYVTSMYDSVTSMAIIITREENEEILDANVFQIKYDNLINELRSINELNSDNHVWSKMYFDHAVYFYKSYESFLANNETKAKGDMQISNSIINMALGIFEVENKVLAYYNNADYSDIIVVIGDRNDVNLPISQNTIIKNADDQKVYVYTNEKTNNSSNLLYYVLVVGLFIIVIVGIVEIERFRRKEKKVFVQKQIAHLDEMLLEGKISSFTYKEMRNKYLEELKKIKEKELKKEKQKVDLKIKREHLLVYKEDKKKQNTKDKKKLIKK